MEAYKWKDENERYKDYWFAIYAYVLVRGDEVYCTQKGIYAENEYRRVYPAERSGTLSRRDI